MKKTFFNKLLLIVVLTVLVSISAAAAGMPGPFDPDKTCTITIQTGSALAAKEEMVVYKVGDVDYTTNALVFTLTDEFASTGVDLYAEENKVRSKNIEALIAKAESLDPLQRVALNADGTGSVDVRPGVYLIYQATEKRAIIQASLVSIPVVNETLNDWDYTITAEPKVEPKEGRVTVKTGDDTNVLPYVGIITAGAGVLVVLILVKKRGRNASDND